MDLVREILRGTADSHGPSTGSAYVDDTHELQEVAYHVEYVYRDIGVFRDDPEHLAHTLRPLREVS